MLKLLKTKLVKNYPVKVPEPIDEGKVVEHECKIHYEVITQAEFDEITKRGNDTDVLKRVVTGWADDQFAWATQSGQPLPFSADALAEFAQVPYVRTALVNGYLAVNTGREAARKN